MEIKSSRNKQKAIESTETSEVTPEAAPENERESYYDHSDDLVARVRTAKAPAQRAMEAFGDPSEYDITIIHGRLKVSETDTDPTNEPQP